MFTLSLFLMLWANLLAYGLHPVVSLSPGTENAAATKKAVAASEQLAWSTDRRLSWEDFKGSPDEGNPHHALTAANLAVNGKCKDNKFVFEVRCVFLPTQSWSKNKTSAKLLYHEQLHFDLTEVHARQLRKDLKNISSSCTNVKDKMNATVSNAFKNWKAEQDKFDKLSRHGLDGEAQAILEADILARLEALEAYK